MRISRRSWFAIAVLLMLGGLALLAGWYEQSRQQPRQAPDNPAVTVTSGADRGPGSLREALFVAAAAEGKAAISIQVADIRLETALPPIANPHGISISAPGPGVIIDARALGEAPVFDIAGPDSSLEGLTIRHCQGAAVLVRAERFRLVGSAIESCEIGVELADNARGFTLERNRFTANRWAVRLAASIERANIVNNEFSANKDAGIWAVRGAPDARNGPIEVQGNRFEKDGTSIVAGNVSMLVEQNRILQAQEAAVHLVGAGAVVRGNRISGGGAMGIIVENAAAAVIENNEIDRLAAYGVMVRGSSNTLVRSNRIHQCGYGIAFVLNDARSPSTAVENTIIAPRYNGIDVIGDSPILRRNRVLRARALPLHVADFQPEGEAMVRSKPFLDKNSFAGANETSSAADSAGGAGGGRP